MHPARWARRRRRQTGSPKTRRRLQSSRVTGMENSQLLKTLRDETRGRRTFELGLEVPQDAVVVAP